MGKIVIPWRFSEEISVGIYYYFNIIQYFYQLSREKKNNSDKLKLYCSKLAYIRFYNPI